MTDFKLGITINHDINAFASTTDFEVAPDDLASGKGDIPFGEPLARL